MGYSAPIKTQGTLCMRIWNDRSFALTTFSLGLYLASTFVVPIYSLLKHGTCLSTCISSLILVLASLENYYLFGWIAPKSPLSEFLSHMPWNLYLDHIISNITLEFDENPSRCFHAKQPQKDRLYVSTFMYSDYPWKEYKVSSDF